MLESEQLREVESNTASAYEAIQRLRPRWLRSRGSTVSGGRFYAVVYVDGSRYGELGVLRSLEVGDIETIRFINSRDATTRYGTGHPGGVIAIATKN